MKTLLVILLISCYASSFCQEPLQLYPGVQLLNLSHEGEKAFLENEEKYLAISEKLSEGIQVDDLTEPEQEIWNNYDETMTGYWQIIGEGCSWYCGGGPQEITASSYLPQQGETEYSPQNAHDLNYKTAWVEGVAGHGIGEFLLYHFTPSSPRITEINVVNGYVKSQKAWENNGRVKTLNMYVDEHLYAVLHLEDKRAANRFSISPLGHPDRGDAEKLKNAGNWTIKFEIAEVYPGKKYEDVVITEIYFDGIDVHCLAAGTQIQMADGSHQNIEDLKTGDAISSFNEAAQRFEPATILELASPIHQDLVEITFADGTSLTCTQDHPIQAADGTWKSFDPEKTAHDYNYEEVKRLEEGDLMMVKGKRAGKTIEAIRELKGLQQTYTIVKLDKNQSFVANGIVVGTEELRQPVVSIRHK